jgi:hypothetical protein
MKETVILKAAQFAALKHKDQLRKGSGEFPASSQSSLSVISATSSLAKIGLSAEIPSRDHLSYITLKFP